MLEFQVPPDRAPLEFSRLPFTSSTVFMLPELRFCPGCLTCAACTLTLAHQAMSFFPYWTLAESTRQIRSRKISPVEIVELHLKRIEKLQPKLNAFVHLDVEGARQQARAAEGLVAQGAQVGPFHGVPPSLQNRLPGSPWARPARSPLPN